MQRLQNCDTTELVPNRKLPAWLRASSRIAAAAIATTTTTITTNAAATAIAAAAITATAAAISTEATSAATATTLTWPRFVDLQHPTGNFPAVELLNRRRRFFLSRHFDKSKTFRLSGVAVFNHTC
jgi:2-methylaconitate cis-trans-isomerase PrpF